MLLTRGRWRGVISWLEMVGLAILRWERVHPWCLWLRGKAICSWFLVLVLVLVLVWMRVLMLMLVLVLVLVLLGAIHALSGSRLRWRRVD